MDKMIGRLDTRLGELGIRENTLLMFIGDNGTLGSVTSRFKGTDYLGGKGSTTARGTHVPFIERWPAVMKNSGFNRDLIGGADFLPPICEAAGVAVPAVCDGVSFLPQLRGEVGSPREAIYLWYSPRLKPDPTVTEFAFDLGRKLYRDGRLYDLGKDPFEATPLASDDAPGVRGRLREVIERYSATRPAEPDVQYAEHCERKGRKK